MKKNKSGSIINIGSMMGTVGVENGNYEGRNRSKENGDDEKRNDV